MITAASKYQPEKGTQFITYFAYWIRQSIFRYNENCVGSVRIPAYMKSNIRKYERFRNEYKNDYGHFPSQEELCRELKLSAYSLDRLEKTIFEMKAVSLDAPAAGGESETAFLDYLQSDDNIEEAVAYSVYHKELRAALEAALSIMDSSTKQMTYSVYFQGNSRAGTAVIFGWSKQNVNERIGRGFYRILHSQYRETLESFMENGYSYYEQAYSGYADLEEAAGNEFLL